MRRLLLQGMSSHVSQAPVRLVLVLSQFSCIVLKNRQLAEVAPAVGRIGGSSSVAAVRAAVSPGCITLIFAMNPSEFWIESVVKVMVILRAASFVLNGPGRNGPSSVCDSPSARNST